ncbi:MAG: ABC transporter ATP-binding protein [Rhodospirillaceae bacterium]|nr:ABC transporter ATP-binding protein [Alphaproteobacteria bacterium]MBT7449733.1 ABC transporter ATP-binding protein [Rhodospirillaceae bacterium]
MSSETKKPLLACRNLFKHFGALAAVNNIDIDVYPGDVLGIGGPNGAGKTTFIDVISGINPASSGTVSLDGHDITNYGPDRICHRGMARTYQLNAGFDSLSVRDNVLVGAAFGSGDQGIPKFRYSKEMMARVDYALELVGMQDRGHLIAREVPVLDRKLLMLASAIATEPKLLLIDEPVGGLTPHEIDHVMEILRGLMKEGITIILIEHVMRFLLQLSTRVLIMHHGESIYEGAPDQLLADQQVVEVYLGEGTAKRLRHLMDQGAK